MHQRGGAVPRCEVGLAQSRRSCTRSCSLRTALHETDCGDCAPPHLLRRCGRQSAVTISPAMIRRLVSLASSVRCDLRHGAYCLGRPACQERSETATEVCVAHAAAQTRYGRRYRTYFSGWSECLSLYVTRPHTFGQSRRHLPTPSHVYEHAMPFPRSTAWQYTAIGHLA